MFANYLQITAVPGAGELAIFCGAMVGAGLGFLWFNTYPAQVFMGDVGALALGGALGCVGFIVRQEIVALLMGGIFVLETASVILQVASFKLTGKRIFRMAPHPPSLRAQGLGRAEDHRALLDHQHPAGAGGARHPEAAMSPRQQRTAHRGRGSGAHRHVGGALPARRGSAVAVTDTRPRRPRSRNCAHWRPRSR